MGLCTLKRSGKRGVYRPLSEIPYRRRLHRLLPTGGQVGGRGITSLGLVASSTGTKSAGSTSSLSFDLVASSTGLKSAASTATTMLSLAGSGSGLKSTSGTDVAYLVLLAVGKTPDPIPFHDFITRRTYTALRKPPFRFLAQNARTGQFLSFELPLIDPTIKLTLSGPTVITGKFKPETINLKDDNRQPLLRSWGTLIHFEMDGQIRASGILMPSGFDGSEWSVEAQGFSTYPNEMPYFGQWPESLKYNIDAIDVIQEIWRYLQSFPNGDLGVTIPRNVGALPSRLGTELDASNVVQPYTIDWWDAKNCGSEIENMARQAPLDYVETARWNSDRSGVNYILTIGYPRLGATRTDLRFVQGENIVEVVPLIELDDFYASGVIGIGAGEGALSIRDMVEINDPTRLRRIYTYRAKKQTDKQRLNSIIRDELLSRNLDREISKIVISSRHPNAVFGSYQVGDDILPQAEIKWWGWTRIWHRILSIEYKPTKDVVSLELKRSSTFRYGQDAGDQ